MEKFHQGLIEMPYWEQDEVFLAVSYPPLVPSVIPDVGTEDGKEISSKSLEAQHIAIGEYRISFQDLHKLEWLMANTGSFCFLIGSYYFLPAESNFVDAGAILFVTGSVTFTVASAILFIRNKCHTMVDMPLTYNGLLYIGANILFIAGCVCFMPRYADQDDATLDAGIALFTMGSLIFTFAPIWNISRTLQLSKLKKIHPTSFYTEMCIGFAYIIGSALFVVGSILFLPTYYAQSADQAVGCFIVGSAFFLLATIITSIVSLIRKIRRFVMSACSKDYNNGSGTYDVKDQNSSKEGLTEAIVPLGVPRSS